MNAVLAHVTAVRPEELRAWHIAALPTPKESKARGQRIRH